MSQSDGMDSQEGPVDRVPTDEEDNRSTKGDDEHDPMVDSDAEEKPSDELEGESSGDGPPRAPAGSNKPAAKWDTWNPQRTRWMDYLSNFKFYCITFNVAPAQRPGVLYFALPQATQQLVKRAIEG